VASFAVRFSRQGDFSTASVAVQTMYQLQRVRTSIYTSRESFFAFHMCTVTCNKNIHMCTVTCNKNINETPSCGVKMRRQQNKRMMRETVMRSANVFIFVSIALAMTFATAVQAKPYHSGQVTAFKPREQLCLRQDCPNAGQVAEMLRGGSTTAGEDEDEEVEADSEKDIEVSWRRNY
jgi:hypothetical protein